MRGPIRTTLGILTLTLLTVSLTFGTAAAFTLLDAAYGTPYDSETPRQVAMGSVGASLYVGIASINANPAMLAYMSDRILLDLNGGIYQANEDRFQPLYDTFQSYVTETAYASNRNSYGLMQGGALFRLSQDRNMAVGVGIFTRYNFDYDYTEEIRDPEGRTGTVPNGTRDQIIQERKYQIQGSLRSFSAGYGMDLIPRLSLGLSVHRYFGTLDHTASTQTTPNYENTLENDPGSAAYKHELSGWSFAVGLAGTVSDRVDLGASYETAFTVEGAISTADSSINKWVPYDQDQAVLELGGGDVKVKYPGTLRVGMTLRPRNTLKTVFTIDVVRRFWEGVADDSYRPTAMSSYESARNTWDFRFGLEHVFYNKVPARFGFRYLENYADPESGRSIFSAGTGFESAGYGIDVTLQYQQQTTRQDYLFDRSIELSDRPQTYPAPQGLSKVEDGILALLVGVTKRF